MNLTKEQIEQIEQFAFRLLSPQDIAIIVEVNVLDLCEAIHTEGTPAHQAFYRGYLRQVVEQLDAIIRSAQNGSNPAQEELLKLIRELQNRLLYG